MSKLTKTGERMVPEKITNLGEYLLYLRHIATYKFIATKCKINGQCLEIGCGEGFGAAILANKTKNILGIDIDQTVIKHAKKRYNKSNLQFMAIKAQKIPFRDEKFDNIVASHVIEHIKEVDAFLDEAKRLLKPNGKFFVVTPNRNYRLEPGEKPWNKYHIKEYNATQLKDSLQKFFRKIEVMGIKGNEEINRIEYNRIKKIRKMLKWDILKTREWLPESIRTSIKEIVKRLMQKETQIPRKFSPQDFIFEYSTDNAFDIMAICTK